MNEHKDTFAKLLSQYHNKCIDDKGLREIEKWAAESEHNRLILELLDGDSELGPDVKRMLEYNQNDAWETICRAEKINKQRKFKTRLIKCTVAASLLIGICLGGFRFYRYESEKEIDNFITSIEPGKPSAILKLSNGSNIAIIATDMQTIKGSETTLMNVNNESIEIKPNKLNINMPQSSTSTLEVPSGAEFSISLSDGTKVWLNSESSITFPTKFTGNTREIKLSGEAYFEIAHNKELPFIVDVNDVKITVLGTKFNVMAYADEDNIETTLINGAVKVQTSNSEQVLVPGEQILWNKKNKTSTIKKVYADTYAGWTEGVFVFFDESIPTICRKLSRWYDVEIDASAKELQNIKFSGVIKKYDMFNDIIQLMSTTNEIKFTVIDSKIIVKSIEN